MVAAFAIAYLSAEDEGDAPALLHVWGGYAAGIILVVRLAWGLIGSRYARFTDFAYRPQAILQYLKDLATGHPRRYLGHSPAGGAMIFALLICLSATVWTGLVAYGDSGKGPLANAGGAVVTTAQAEENEHRSRRAAGQDNEGAESPIGEFHSVLANITVGLVVLHILGVGLSSVLHRENLVGAMVSGRKRAEDD